MAIKQLRLFLSLAALTTWISAQAQTIEPVDSKDLTLKNYSTSWIGNDGGYEEVHIPHDMWNIFTNRDGIVATICGWDEGGTNVGVYQNGRLISRPEGSGTGGWGRHSGKAVVIDDQYVYQLLTQHGCDGGNDGGMLAGYRFDEQTCGYIAIPFLFVHNGDPDKNRDITFWVDQNGDAIRQENEFQNSTEVNQYSMSMFVDHAGNIWRGTRQQGCFFWKCKGLSKNGIPQYDKPLLFPLPEGFGDAKRVYYDPSEDALYLAGFSPAHPDGRDTWWDMGSTIVRCNRFLEKAAAGQITDGWTSDMTLYIPFNIEDGSQRNYTNAKAFTVEGDYIFVALARYGYITVYDAHSGKLVGRIEPGENVKRQSGHNQRYNSNAQILDDFRRTPAKPIMEIEPLYEDHPLEFRPDDDGHSNAWDVRRTLYWSVFYGSAGITYGHHSVWQMYDPDKGRHPINRPLMPWYKAIDQPAAGQVIHLRHLMESRPYFDRVPAPDFIVPSDVHSSVPGAGRYRFVATMDEAGSYAMVYTPIGREFAVRGDMLKADKLTAWWYNPRTGKAKKIRTMTNNGETITFCPPMKGEAVDWVLVLDDASKRYPAPGRPLKKR